MTQTAQTERQHPGRDRGRQARQAVPRTDHARWEAQDAARDPVEILEAQAADRVPDLVPIRYARMLVSPFTFYRGAAAVMAADLAATPSTGLQVQLCGDAHLANFGGFATPERSLIFDLNDFDETLPGPFEWDVKRLVASFAVAGRHRGFSEAERAASVREVVGAYRDAMREFSEMSRLDVWYARMDADELAQQVGPMVDEKSLARFRKTVAKAQRKDSSAAFSRYAELGPDGRLRPINQPPLVVPVDELFPPDVLHLVHEVIEQSMAAYLSSLADDKRHLMSGFEIVGVARKVVGVGSVGTRCWIVLMVGKENPLDDLVMQVKEANASVLEPYLGASVYPNHGQRVVEGQRLMQAASDALLGWQRTLRPDGEARDFYVRQMWDGKVSANLDVMPLPLFHRYAGMCGWTLARAHARSGDRHEVAGYLGGSSRFADAMVAFAEAYADQNERDYARLQQAAAGGRIPVAEQGY